MMYCFNQLLFLLHYDQALLNLVKLLFQAFSRVFAFSYKNSVLVPKTCDILENKAAPNFYCFNGK